MVAQAGPPRRAHLLWGGVWTPQEPQESPPPLGGRCHLELILPPPQNAEATSTRSKGRSYPAGQNCKTKRKLIGGKGGSRLGALRGCRGGLRRQGAAQTMALWRALVPYRTRYSRVLYLCTHAARGTSPPKLTVYITIGGCMHRTISAKHTHGRQPTRTHDPRATEIGFYGMRGSEGSPGCGRAGLTLNA